MPYRAFGAAFVSALAVAALGPAGSASLQDRGCAALYCPADLLIAMLAHLG
jgi:hypothetical protein